ncbi:hypothetical protein [Gimesia aquarii]|uniref:Lipocalin-like domain-containing protein n=1 Tax=Gimesia aquarii TaxID=2527964 RepID=A0A517VY85_9PLAN|nr:hypothetical protein [Gimesia aquarii]QDT97969.1 hypothetical protein V144x_34520 [Gimesia aquarii]
MRKTGIIFVILMGISMLILSKTRNSDQNRSKKSLRAAQLTLQQIPARIKSRPSVARTVTSTKTDTSPALDETVPSASFQGLSTDEILAKLVGQWEQTKSNSKRILTIKENGAATMVIQPQGIWKTILGNQITIDIEWSLNEGTLTLRTVGGKPENKLEYINQVWGDKFTRKIHSIEDKMFTLRDDEGDVSQKWVRTSY